MLPKHVEQNKKTLHARFCKIPWQSAKSSSLLTAQRRKQDNLQEEVENSLRSALLWKYPVRNDKVEPMSQNQSGTTIAKSLSKSYFSQHRTWSKWQFFCKGSVFLKHVQGFLFLVNDCDENAGQGLPQKDIQHHPDILTVVGECPSTPDGECPYLRIAMPSRIGNSLLGHHLPRHSDTALALPDIRRWHRLCCSGKISHCASGDAHGNDMCKKPQRE
jgi:hypothetical protein